MDTRKTLENLYAGYNLRKKQILAGERKSQPIWPWLLVAAGAFGCFGLDSGNMIYTVLVIAGMVGACVLIAPALKDGGQQKQINAISAELWYKAIGELFREKYGEYERTRFGAPLAFEDNDSAHNIVVSYSSGLKWIHPGKSLMFLRTKQHFDGGDYTSHDFNGIAVCVPVGQSRPGYTAGRIEEAWKEALKEKENVVWKFGTNTISGHRWRTVGLDGFSLKSEIPGSFEAWYEECLKTAGIIKWMVEECYKMTDEA